MRQLTIISGKGGTGKTSITAAFATLGGKKVVLADCDVDAADLHLLLHPDFGYAEDFYSRKMAYIDSEKCNQCGICLEKCRFDAIQYIDDRYVVNEIDCEGCGYCYHICPVNAIEFNNYSTGKFFKSKTRMNTALFHASLNIAADNSGKLVTKVKKEATEYAREHAIPYVVVDGSPGIGCPVIASITGVDLVLIVTEPTVSGLHDLIRVYELVQKFGIKAVCVINKFDLNVEMTRKILTFLHNKQIPLIAEIPYDNTFIEAIMNEKTIIEYDNGNTIKPLLEKSWNKIVDILNSIK